MGGTTTPVNQASSQLILIAIAGRKHAGKSTLADMIAAVAAAEGCRVAQRGCSELVAREAAALIAPKVGANPEQAYSLLMGPGKEAYRPLLQFQGASQRERHGDDYWLRQMSHEIECFAAETERHHMSGRTPKCLFIMSGIRFENEAEWARGRGGYAVRVERPGLPQNDTHITERSLDGYPSYDYVVTNAGSLRGLSDEALRVWHEMSAQSQPLTPESQVKWQAA